MKGQDILDFGLFVACSIGVCGKAAAAPPAAPPAGYTIEEKYTRKSPDDAIAIEQYANKGTDDWTWQFWVRRQGSFTLLDPEPADYPVGFHLHQRSEMDRSRAKDRLRHRLRFICTASTPQGYRCARARSRSATWRGTI